MVTRRPPRSLLVLLAALALAAGLAACGDDGGDADADGPTTTTDVAPGASGASDDGTPTSGDGTSPEGTADEPSDTTAADDPDDTTATSEGAADPTDPEDLPGEPAEIHPFEGASLAVVGVEAGDTLNVREGPGVDFPVVVELAPLDDGLAATGRNRFLDDDSLWAEVEVDGVTGWANATYLAQLGATRDASGEVGAPSGDTAAELARAVAEGLVSPDEGPTPTVTVAAAGDSDATADVLGFGDDAVRGSRVRVTIADGAATVLVTPLCARGVSDGLCL